MKNTIIISFLILSSFISLRAQNADDFQFINAFEHESLSKEKYNVASTTHNEAIIWLKGMFIFYKKFISSQDSGNCNFHPSCSVYAIHSIQQKGIVMGILNSFDRLTRCNSTNKEDYPIHHQTKLLYDPVN